MILNDERYCTQWFWRVMKNSRNYLSASAKSPRKGNFRIINFTILRQLISGNCALVALLFGRHQFVKLQHVTVGVGHKYLHQTVEPNLPVVGVFLGL